MTTPFIVFGLPRSRTTWLSQWLSYGGRLVGHDTAVECATVQQFLDQFWYGRLSGTVETGAMIAGRLLRYAMPSARFIVVRRSVADVEASLARFGVIGIRPELEKRNASLDDLVRSCGADEVRFEDLSDIQCCARLFEACLGMPFDSAWHAAHGRRNIQVDVVAELALVQRNADQIAALKTEVETLTASLSCPEPPSFVRVGLERWQTFWPEAKPLGEAHYSEVGSDQRPGPAYDLDASLMSQIEASGALKIVSARINERLVGYCMWSLTRDAERGGIPFADQGPWYVSPSAPKRLHLGRRLLDTSFAILRSLGVMNLDLHHNVAGRGARVGTLFGRLGAVEYQRRYSLCLGQM